MAWHRGVLAILVICASVVSADDKKGPKVTDKVRISMQKMLQVFIMNVGFIKLFP